MKNIFIVTCLLLAVSCNNDPSIDPAPEPPLNIPPADTWWNDEVFYEILVRSFYDSDGNGVGDFQGLIQKLDYLNDGDPTTSSDLGITGIWLMPIFPSPSYHGYDVTDYRSVNPQYGSMDDFKQFLDAAHQRGIKVIIDFVVNHTSDQHPWFIKSAEGTNSDRRNWYVWASSNPGYLGPWGQTVWHQRNGAYYYGAFWSGMPDLNYNNKSVSDEVKDIARYWYEEVGVDGYRVDAPGLLIASGENQVDTQPTLDWWRNFYAFQKNLDPGFMTVGEVWTTTPKIIPYADQRFDYCFEFDLAYAIIDAVKNGNANWLTSKIPEVISSYTELQYGTFLTNHDQNRVIEELGQDVNKARMAASILLTLPGVPYLYYGEEVGMRGVKPDEDIRRPMQWTSGTNAGFTSGSPWRSINTNYGAFNVEVLSDDPGSLWNHYRRLIHARTESLALRRGGCEIIGSATNSVLAYLRTAEDEAVLVIHNVATPALQGVQISAVNSELAGGTYAAFDLVTGDEAGLLTVESQGGFNATSLIDNLDGLTSYFFRLERQ